MREMQIIKKAYRYFKAGKYGQVEELLASLSCPVISYPQSAFMRGAIMSMRAEPLEAEKFLCAAIKLDSRNAEYQLELANLYFENRRYDLSRQYYLNVISLEPRNAMAHASLCYVYRTESQFDKALSAGEAAVSIDPNSGQAHNNLAIVYSVLGQRKKSYLHYERAYVLSPNDFALQLNMASAYLSVGKNKEAEKIYNKVIKKNPRSGESYRMLAEMKKFSVVSCELVTCIDDALMHDGVSDIDRADMLFAKGKVFDDCGRCDDAFQFFTTANALVNNGVSFSADKCHENIDCIIEIFNMEFFLERQGFGRPDEAPILIVGMPRSGTTLVETILASHAEVYAGGELEWFNVIPGVTKFDSNGVSPYPEAMPSMDRSSAVKLADEYSSFLQSLNDSTRLVINKLPGNFLYLGLVKLLFPNAKVIHCVRDPLDTCFSLYSRHFLNGLEFSYNLENLGTYYGEYLRLMRHWHTVFGEGYILNLSYESLVNDQESCTRKLLDYVDLEWDDACMNFYRDVKHVTTSSQLSVRKPLHRGAVGRSAPYRDLMKPLIDAMNAASLIKDS